VVAIHSSVITPEPVIIVLGLKNVHHALAQLRNGLAPGNGGLLVVRGAVGLLVGLRVLVLREGTGGERGDEGNCDDGVGESHGKAGLRTGWLPPHRLASGAYDEVTPVRENGRGGSSPVENHAESAPRPVSPLPKSAR